jgi:hypothetical protein
MGQFAAKLVNFANLANLLVSSDVPAPAWPESPGFGLA